MVTPLQLFLADGDRACVFCGHVSDKGIIAEVEQHQFFIYPITRHLVGRSPRFRIRMRRLNTLPRSSLKIATPTFF